MVDVINARFAAPVDETIYTLLKSGKSIITVEDHHLACGFGSAILELVSAKCGVAEKVEAEAELAPDELKNNRIADIRVLGVPRKFIGHNTRNSQLMQACINAEKIVKTAKEMVYSMLDAQCL